ncbi:MAG: metal-dependent transcriptional regulator [Slackia faecicanis]|nr:metal-dependent transcriptional regulator [Slackia faecicanis]
MTDMQTETMLETRTDGELSHSLEDYLEVIADLAGDSKGSVRAVDVATKLGVSKASVSKAVANLKEKGYVEQPYYGDITMTEEGYAYGSAMWLRHNLLFRFLTEKIGVDPELANYEACQLEHGISRESFEKWKKYLESVGIEDLR